MTPTPDVPATPVASGTPVPEAVIRIAKYAVSCLPRAHRSYWHFTVWVVERAPNEWEVRADGTVHDADGNPIWGPLPLEDREAWHARHRFDLDTAVEIAKKIAPTLTVNGYTVADALGMGGDR